MTIHSALMYLIAAALAADGLNIIIIAFESAYGFTRGQMNIAAAAGTWLSVVAAFFFAWIVMKKGPKKVTMVSLVLMGVAVILFGRITTILGFFLGIFAFAVLVNGIGWTTTNTLVSNWFIRKRGLAFGISTMGLPLATAAFVPVVNFLITRYGISRAFLFTGVAILLLAPVTFFWIKDTPEEAGLTPDGADMSPEEIERLRAEMAHHQSQWTIPKLLKNREAWLISLGFGLLFIVTVGIVTQLVPRLTDRGFSQDAAVAFLSAAAVIGIPGSFVWGWIDQKLGVRSAAIIYCGWYMLATVLLLIASNGLMTVVTVFFTGIALGGIGNLYPSMVAYVFGRQEFASVNRMINVVVSCLRPLGFAVMGIAYDATHSYDAGYIVLIGVCAVAIVLLSMVRKNYNPDLEITAV
jgi:sugar phosphate permease